MRLLPAACALFLAACSAAHMTDPGHSWTPWSDASRKSAAEGGRPAGWRAAGWKLLDALAMPFHALGHVFGQAPTPQTPP